MRKIRFGLLIVASVLLLGCSANVEDGVAFLEEGKYEEAITCFEKDIAEEKNLDEAYRGLGNAYYELGEFQSAAEAFEKALKNEAEETATIYNLMAASYLQLDEYESALKYYAKALKMDDCGAEMEQEIHYNEIAIYQILGDWDTVKEKVASYVEAYPDDDRMDKTVEFLETR